MQKQTQAVISLQLSKVEHVTLNKISSIIINIELRNTNVIAYEKDDHSLLYTS